MGTTGIDSQEDDIPNFQLFEWEHDDIDDQPWDFEVGRFQTSPSGDITGET